MNLKRVLFILSAVLVVMVCRAQSVDDIRALIASGEYAEATEAARQALETDTQNAGTLNALLGEALYLTGNVGEAEDALRVATSKGVADAYRWLGRIAYDKYDLGTASADYDKYFDMKKKASKATDPAAADERDRIALAERYIDRVEQIQVIDSLTVPKEEFFKHYRLPAASGRLLGNDGVPNRDADDVASVVFATERGDRRMWARLDSLGTSRIAQSVHLTDGTWTAPELTDSVLNIGNADFPFMTSDGMTLYFASDGDESIGGLDIFMATRDPSDDTYRKPQNIGMPYNSPWDDYMLAIDEVNNIGWWATDRNRLGDEVTIYIYIPNDVRVNYPSDTDNLRQLALLTSIEETWDEDEDYEALREIIDSLQPDADTHSADFRFALPDGRVLTRWSEIPDEDVIEMMDAYLTAQNNLAEVESELRDLRRLYHDNRSEAIADRIEALESTLDAYYKTLRKQRSALTKALSDL